MSFSLSKIILGNLLLILVVSGIFIFMSDVINKYAVPAPSGYEEGFQKINASFAQISFNINKTDTDLRKISSETAGTSNRVLDFISFFFNAGYSAAITAAASISGINVLTDVAIDSLPLGIYGSSLKLILLLMIIVVLAIGILLKMIIKSGAE